MNDCTEGWSMRRLPAKDGGRIQSQRILLDAAPPGKAPFRLLSENSCRPLTRPLDRVIIQAVTWKIEAPEVMALHPRKTKPPHDARPTGERLLLLLKTRGPQAAADLAAALGVTGEAARQQLLKLAGGGL